MKRKRTDTSVAVDAATTRDLKTALRGLDYPATRSKLFSIAAINDAPPAILKLIAALPEMADFLNEQELHEALGVTVHGEHPHGWE